MDSSPEALQFTVHIHPEDGSLWAEVAELPGCFASGSDEDELREALIEAISMYLSTEDAEVQVRLTQAEPIKQVEEPNYSIEQVEEQKYLVCH